MSSLPNKEFELISNKIQQGEGLILNHIQNKHFEYIPTRVLYFREGFKVLSLQIKDSIYLGLGENDAKGVYNWGKTSIKKVIELIQQNEVAPKFIEKEKLEQWL